MSEYSKEYIADVQLELFPELLAALEDMMRDIPMCPHPSVPPACRYCFAREVIAKARSLK